MDDPDEYEVGYKKPPKHSQFKPGQSPNPRGRPRGSRGLKSDLAAELSARQTIQINRKTVKGTRQRLMLMTLATRAAAGDLRATNALISLVVQVLGVEDRGGSQSRLSLQDQALLQELLNRDSSPKEPHSDA